MKIFYQALVLLLSISCSLSTYAKKDKALIYIKGLGGGVFGEAGTMTRYAQYRTFPNTDSAEFLSTVGRPVSVSLFHIGINNHIVLKSFNKENSCSVHFFPTIGFSYAAGRLFNITAPLMICYNMGNMATYESKRSAGITIGIGVEWIKAGLFNVLGDNFRNEYNEAFRSKGILQPCGAVGLRYTNKVGKPQEINFKYGMHTKQTTEDLYGDLPIAKNFSSTNIWFRLSIVRYMGK